MSKSNHKKMSKPPQDGNTKQMDIFRALLSPDNDVSALSNLLDTWDQIPKFHVTQAKQKRIREEGAITTVQDEVVLGGDSYEININPAIIKVDGKNQLYFPSETEEVIETILRKMLLDQNLGIHRNKPQSTWVKFSIRMIRDELKKVGKTRSNAQIRHSLYILTRSILIVKKNGKTIHTGGILSGWIDKPNEHLESDHEDALSAIQFSTMVSRSISELDFRQYDYLTTTTMKNPVSRWLMKRLSIHFRGAGRNYKKDNGHNSFKIDYSVIVSESLLLDSIKLEKDRKKKVRKAINELIKSDVILSSEESGIELETAQFGSDGKTIIGTTFNLCATQSFTAKMKASMKQRNTIEHNQKVNAVIDK